MESPDFLNKKEIDKIKSLEKWILTQSQEILSLSKYKGIVDIEREINNKKAELEKVKREAEISKSKIEHDFASLKEKYENAYNVYSNLKHQYDMETKEKKVLKFRYENSGVKTLSGFGKFFYVIGLIALFVALICGIVCLGRYVLDSGDATSFGFVAGVSFSIGITSFFTGIICAGLSNIAKTALYHRTVLESQYEFWNVEEKGELPKKAAGDNASANSSVKDSKENMLVVNLKNEKQMRIKKRLENGKYECYSGGVYAGDFDQSEFVEFNTWVKEFYKRK
jgi:hypothetical protein